MVTHGPWSPGENILCPVSCELCILPPGARTQESRHRPHSIMPPATGYIQCLYHWAGLGQSCSAVASIPTQLAIPINALNNSNTFCHLWDEKLSSESTLQSLPELSRIKVCCNFRTVLLCVLWIIRGTKTLFWISPELIEQPQNTTHPSFMMLWLERSEDGGAVEKSVHISRRIKVSTCQEIPTENDKDLLQEQDQGTGSQFLLEKCFCSLFSTVKCHINMLLLTILTLICQL